MYVCVLGYTTVLPHAEGYNKFTSLLARTRGRYILYAHPTSWKPLPNGYGLQAYQTWFLVEAFKNTSPKGTFQLHTYLMMKITITVTVMVTLMVMMMMIMIMTMIMTMMMTMTVMMTIMMMTSTIVLCSHTLPIVVHTQLYRVMQTYQSWDVEETAAQRRDIFFCGSWCHLLQQNMYMVKARNSNNTVIKLVPYIRTYVHDTNHAGSPMYSKPQYQH